MPSTTFLKSSKEKQDKIVNAAMKEFSRVPYHEASINRIIQEISMPRGTFYLYFKDKEDLYFYLVKTYEKHLITSFNALLEENKGDIFKTFSSFLDFLLEKEVIGKNRKFYIFFLQNMNFHFEKKSLFKKQFAWKTTDNFLIKEYTKQSLKQIEEEDFDLLFEFLIHGIIYHLVHVVVLNEDKEKAKKRYQKELYYLQNGFLKTKEDFNEKFN